ncbi:hypothetical protein MKW98_028975 [Papaver atlanticum]|uniref:Protein TIC 20 n=1 Tax=Papaver atlanticum TaxID=357466 RepID=A0AAD4Y017_9MAGN|nr:hypothetical protein MKW98_028975 [Papaver atlanticum]
MATTASLLRFTHYPTPQTLKKPYFPSPLPPLRFNTNNPLTSLIHPTTSKPPPPSCHKKSTTISSSYTAVPAAERLITAVAYCLPFFNGIQYGRYLFVQYPNLGALFEPIFPLLSLYRSVPYASFVAFFGLYIGVARNASLSRFVRFNTMQAVVLDVLLVLPLLVQRVFNPGKGLGFKLMMMGYNFIFVFIVICFLYSAGFSILGKTPYLPLVGVAADRQL